MIHFMSSFVLCQESVNDLLDNSLPCFHKHDRGPHLSADRDTFFSAAIPEQLHKKLNTLFNRALTTVDPLYKQIATVTPSTTDVETYAWLGDIPGMREWIGDREIQNLAASGYTIKNKDFELTIGIDRNAIEDDKIGLYNPSVEMLAQSAAMHPDELVFALLASGFSAKCYDGKPFFSDAHQVGKKTASNKGTAQLSLDAYIAARAGMMSLTNAKGRALNIVPDLLVVPPALEAKAREILVLVFVKFFGAVSRDSLLLEYDRADVTLLTFLEPLDGGVGLGLEPGLLELREQVRLALRV